MKKLYILAALLMVVFGVRGLQGPTEIGGSRRKDIDYLWKGGPA